MTRAAGRRGRPAQGWLARRLRLQSATLASALRNHWRNVVWRRATFPLAHWKAVRGIPVRCGEGLRIFLKPGDRVISGSIVAHGGFAAAEVATLCRFLPPGGVAVDVGANIGCHSLAFARQVGPRGRVLAFEPEPGNRRLLAASARLNGFGHLEVHPVALSDRPGRLALGLAQGNSGAHSVTVAATPGVPGTVAVEADTLDAAVARAGVERVDLVKIDVEGFEWRVVQGGREVLRRHRPVVMTEFCPLLLAAQGGDPAAYLEAFARLGYAFWVLAGDGTLVGTTARQVLASSPPAGTNLLLVPPGEGGPP